MINLDPALRKALADYSSGRSEEMARNSGAVLLSSGCFCFSFLGREIRVTFPEGEFAPELSEQSRILCLHYLSSAKGAPLTGRWVAFRELPGGSIYAEPFSRRTVAPLVAAFAHRPQALSLAAAELGGKIEPVGDVAVTVPVFPRLPVTYVLWLGDEEFAAHATVLFDESAKHYLPTEDLVVAAGEGLWRMKAIADAAESSRAPAQPPASAASESPAQPPGGGVR